MEAAYTRPLFLFNAHLETIYPALFRQVRGVAFTRERITTGDEDFLDLDWLQQGSGKLIIVSHGLEGNSSRAYMKGMALAGFRKSFDVLAWNFRGCSGEINKRLRFYHSGATDDLDVVIRHAIQKGYHDISLIGFSLGGNLTLKYLGERPPYAELKRACVISVPMDLYTSSLQITMPSNRVYSNRFLKSLIGKVVEKSTFMPEIDVKGIEKISTLLDFDDRYTAPIHGYRNARDYYKKCSSLFFLEGIKIPTLIMNALNDPFLSEACFPTVQVAGHPFIKFESPLHGGHVGFAQFNKNGLYWSEERAIDFLEHV